MSSATTSMANGKASGSRVEGTGTITAFPSNASGLTPATLVATLPLVRRYRASVRTGWPGVSLL